MNLIPHEFEESKSSFLICIFPKLLLYLDFPDFTEWLYSDPPHIDWSVI